MKTKEFINKLRDNDELARRVANAENPEQAYEIAKETGVTDSKEVFCKEMKAFKKAVVEMEQSELEVILGSTSTTEVVSAVSTYIGAAAAAGSAAAA